MKAFTMLSKGGRSAKFIWGPEQQIAFNEMKKVMSSPLILVSPKKCRPLKLYVAASEETIGSLMAQDDDEDKERVIYYLSKTLNDAEGRYSTIEKLCYSLYYACTKHKYYLVPHDVYVFCKVDLIKYMLNRPVLKGRLVKWFVRLMPFELKYMSLKTVKEQDIADFLAEHSISKSIEGIGVVIFSPCGEVWRHFLRLQQASTNNQAKYEAFIFGLHMLAIHEARQDEARTLLREFDDIVMSRVKARWEKIVLHMLGAAKLVKCMDQFVKCQLRSYIPLLSYDLLEDAVLPVEIGVPSLQVAQQHGLSIKNYHWALYDELDQAEEERWTAFKKYSGT
ncbi:uncharacterized protein LOC127254391 [Andrographis paniculata]|uniref:uncharacterized protein LOC127254391 n=1 Tax=Andrographis paniculata TaxID=175694 RepID=UPI0021E74924|nr:uncharacterized protein LOC127254391 [Andrographis paniculata]